MARKKPTFEESLARLEEISEQIETGKIGLEDSIDRYEEGMKLVQHCRSILGKAEQRIARLQDSEDGKDESADDSAPGEQIEV